MILNRKFQSVLYFLLSQIIYRFFLGKIGFGSRIISPLKVNGARNIFIGKNVVIQNLSWLAAVPLTGKKAELVIEDGVIIGHFAHIFCTKKILIRRDALLADKVYIADNTHQYGDISLPIKNQPIKQLDTVEIGANCWIGENVCIYGASIGRGSVIGANSVVTKSIPEFSVAVGSPARVIKQFDLKKKEWIPVNNQYTR